MANKKAWRNRIIGYGEESPEQLLANPKNFRIHPKSQQDALLGVMREVGIVDDVLVNQSTGFVVDGHLRIALAISENQPTIPVKYLDLTEAEEALILATFDPISALAVADKEQLDSLLREVSTGEAAVQAMLADLAKDAGLYLDKEKPEAPEAQIDKAEELREKWGTARGQIWEIPSLSVPGKAHRLMCGDSTSAEDVARLMDGRQADMIFADPPYGISIVATNGYVGGGEAYDIPFGGVKNSKGFGTIGGSKPFGSKRVRGSDGASHIVEAGKYLPVKGDDTTDTAIAAYSLLVSAYANAVHIWWGGNYYANELPPSSCWIVWDKENTGNFADIEMAWTNQRKAARLFRHKWNGMIKASERGQRRVHPTQKPVALAEWCYETFGKEGDLILDPMACSGITLVAAERMGRQCYAIEYEADYIGIALQRLADMGLEPRLIVPTVGLQEAN